MPLVVAFAGRIGSGKTTITSAVARTLGWPRASFGDYVRSVARQQQLKETRQNLQNLGTHLLRQDAHGFCASVLSSCGWKPPADLLIDGLRHVETIDLIRQLVTPAILKIVFITVQEGTRLTRLRERGEGNADAISQVEDHSSEQQVNFELREVTDLVVDGDRPVGEVVAQLVAWIRAQENGR